MSQQINLFNPIFLKQKKVFSMLPMVQALGIILLGTLGVAFYGSQRVAALEREATAVKQHLAQKQAQLGTVTTQFAPRQPSQTLLAELAQGETQLRSLREVEAILKRGELGNTDGYAEYFRALARQNVHGLWLTGVSIVGSGIEIGVQGRAMQAPLIPSYIGRLTSESVLRGKTFASLEIGRPELAGAAAASPVAAAGLAAPYVEFTLQSSAVAGAAESPKEFK